MRNLSIGAVLAAGLLLSTADGAAAGAPSALSPRLQQSRDLLARYYGDPALLQQAAVLVEAELRDSPDSAPPWAQAAQITGKGGHIVGDLFEPGVKARMHALVDRALEIDPRYPPALTLRAEEQFQQHDVEGGCATARAGLAIDPSFPWLHLAMARCLDAQKRFSAAVGEEQIVVDAGPGTTDVQRHVYVSAISDYARHFVFPANKDFLKDLARQAAAAADPHDAWTLGEFADMFNDIGDYDDGIAYARKALAIRDYGLGREVLQTALAGKAAHPTNPVVDDGGMGKSLPPAPTPR